MAKGVSNKSYEVGGKVVYMETLLSILLIVVVYCLCKSNEWKSNNRISPPGYHTDWKQMNIDHTLHGKDYVHRKNIAGGYDVKNENDKLGI